jgi:hypothetical protein
MAAVLVVFLGGLLFVRPAIRPATTGPSRVAGLMLSALGVAVLLVVGVLAAAGISASKLDPALLGEDRPTGPFARYLVDLDPTTTERVGTYAAAILLPLAATLGVLALAAVDVGRSLGLRVIAALTSGAIVAGCWRVATQDAGPLASRAAVGVGALATGALLAFLADELPRRATARR